ncbi:MAG: methyltransferase domain-containing protein [Oscillospiraceae bacterium]|nr:methyltransferase domain-containing protein [Oscillospiraceae bacterium]
MSWNSEQYLKFKTERTQPAIDLANRITAQSARDIIDIGCGPGNSTEILKKRYHNATVVGADNSENMLETARKNHADIEFILCDASRDLCRLGRKFDVVFSNACIQWVPDHPKLLREMLSLLKDGGILAVQIPMNYDEPIHKIIDEVTSSEKWRDKFNDPRHFYTLTPEKYYDILSEISSDFSMWQTTYFHRMKSHSDIMEWYKSTGLRPYLEALSSADKAEFEKDIFTEVENAYPKQTNGEIIFRFPRLFFTANK